MSRGWTVKASSWLPKIPRSLTPSALFVLSFVLYHETLRGGFVWDDRPAVVENRDVWVDSAWGDVWRHDFWGQQMTDAGSHKSFRPLTTLSYRVSNVLAQSISTEEGGDDAASNDHIVKENGVSVTKPKASPPSKTRVARGPGPEVADAAGFHLVNVLVYAATCSSSVILFRAVFSGEELPAVAASLLFTVHPVHVEAVAPIVGRADLLCGLLSVIALSLTIAGTRVSGSASGHTDRVHGDKNNDAAGGPIATPARCSTAAAETPPRDKVPDQADAAEKAPTAAAIPEPPPEDHEEHIAEEEGEEVAEEEKKAVLVAAATISKVSEEVTASPALALEQTICFVSSDEVGRGNQGNQEREEEEEKQEGEEGKKREGTKGHGWGAAGTTPSSLPSLRPDAAVAAMVRLDEYTPPARRGTDIVGEEDTGPGVSRFCTALFLAAAATLCKELGVTVFGLMAGGEVVRFFEELDRRQRQGKRQGPRSTEPTTGEHEVSKGKVARARRWCRFVRRLPSAAATRVASTAVGAATMVVFHVRLREGAGVREWGVLENDISILASRKERALSYAFTHAVYAYKLLWPAKLSYDWGFSCLPHVTSLVDPANLGALTLYASILWGTVWAVVHRDTALMWALGFLVVPFLPASNLFFPVGAVVAERLLYLPSLGACVLAGCLLRHRGTRHGAAPSCAPDGGETSTANREHKAGPLPNNGGEEEGEKRGDESNGGSSCSGSPCKTDSSPALLTRPDRQQQQQQQQQQKQQQQQQQQGPPLSASGRPCSPPSWSSSAATRAPACSSSSAILLTPKQNTEIAAPARKLALGRSLLPTRRCAVMVALLAWAVVFGAGTVWRCREWNSERALFEAALEVCPDGIKTLNNVAVGMLNQEEAGRAEVLLRRAVELHPEYGFAMFNLGVSLMINRDLVGAVIALERSLVLEPRKTKIMVYLGKAYLHLTSKALENPSAWAGQGNGGVGFEVDGTYRDGHENENNGEDISNVHSMSPESLLSSAEMYIDQALAAGSGLPLARLVKGQALALRGQHKSAAGFFQDSIDKSLDLLAGRSSSSSSGGGGNIESMVASDAIDLASTYNRLGLALRDSGSDVFATKDVFLAGLLAAPEDFALLVNGGVAHQAAGDIPGAKALYDRALSLQPNSPELLSNVGFLEEQIGGGSRTSMEKAAALYTRALELLDAGSPVRGQVEINLKNVQEGLADDGRFSGSQRRGLNEQ